MSPEIYKDSWHINENYGLSSVFFGERWLATLGHYAPSKNPDDPDESAVFVVVERHGFWTHQAAFDYVKSRT